MSIITVTTQINEKNTRTVYRRTIWTSSGVDPVSGRGIADSNIKCYYSQPIRNP